MPKQIFRVSWECNINFDNSQCSLCCKNEIQTKLLKRRELFLLNINTIWFLKVVALHSLTGNYTLRTTKLLGDILVWGVYCFHSVRPSIRPASRVRSVVPTVLVGSISYSYILSSNFRRCVTCKVSCKISKIWIFGYFFKFVTLTLSCIDLGSDVNH